MRVLRLLKIPGMVIGFVAGLLVGGLASVAGAPTGYIIVAALGLGIPLAIFGQGITLQQESNVLSFLAYQAIMGFGYGIGFLMIHGQIIEMSAWREYRRQTKEERGSKQPQAAEKQA